MRTHGAAPGADSDLRFLPLEAIRPHEEAAACHGQPLYARLDGEGYLRNPVLVAPTGPDTYVLLDGTHRLAYLREQGYRDALVQVVRPDARRSARLATWAHLGRVDAGELRGRLAALGVTLVAEAHPCARDRGPAGDDVAWLTFAETPDTVHRLRGRNRVALLHALVGCYRPERVAPEDLPGGGRVRAHQLFAGRPAYNLLVRFAPTEAALLPALVRAGVRIPSGITRLQVAEGRVLGVNAPLDLLRYGADPPERARWLAALTVRVPRRVPGPALVYEPRARRYAEPLIVYDPALRVEACPAGPRGLAELSVLRGPSGRVLGGVSVPA